MVGAGLLGAAVGASLDSPGQTKFVLSYGVRTADGQVHEVRVESGDEIAKPAGQCVYLSDLTQAPAPLCISDKVEFLRLLSTMDAAGNGLQFAPSPQDRGPVPCRVPNVGLMTLNSAACRQLQGTIEK
jgi:hypothetical protein